MMVRRVLIRSALVSAAAGALVASQSASAQSLNYADLTISSGAQYSTNPFLTSGNSSGAASANVEVRPSVHVARERAQLSATAFYQRQEYFRTYGGTDAFGGGLSGSYILSPKASLSTSIDYSDSILVAGDVFRTTTITNPDGSVSQVPATPGVIDPALGDVGLLGSRQRRTLLSESLALNLTAGPRDSISFSLSGSRSKYPGAASNISNFRQLGGGFSYNRTLSETRTVGVRFGFSDVKYDGSTLGSKVYSPELTFSQKLPNHWFISASGGASFVQQSSSTFSSSTSSFSFSLSACRSGDRSNFCLNASRSVLASAQGAARPQTVAGVTYGYKLDRSTNLNLNASYSRASQASTLGQFVNQNYYTSDLSVSRQVGRRLSLNGGVSIQGVDDQLSSRPANFSGRVGLSYSLGSRR